MPSACCRLMSRHVQRALGARPLLHRSLLRLGRRRGVRAVRGHRACIQGRRYEGATTRLRQRAVHHRRHPALASDDRSAAPRDHRVRDRRARDGAPDRWRRRHGWDRRPSWLLPKMHVYMPDIIRCVKTLLLSLRAAALRHLGMCTWRWRRRRGKGLGMLQNSMRMPTIKLLRLVLSFVNAVANV